MKKIENKISEMINFYTDSLNLCKDTIEDYNNGNRYGKIYGKDGRLTAKNKKHFDTLTLLVNKYESLIEDLQKCLDESIEVIYYNQCYSPFDNVEEEDAFIKELWNPKVA